MVYILPLSSYKNNEQLINKSCPELFFCPEKKLRESADFPRRFPELFSVVQYSVFIKDHSPMISYRDFCLKLRLDQSVSITFTFVNYVHLLCLSIEEYKEVSERYEFMSAQVNDVEKSKKEIEKLITDLTKQMKEVFVESFDQINKNFTYTFKELFGGGTASLSLADPENILTSGIDILVHPPGKIVINLEALSGGEKALVAIALYFAIMKVRPAPFCVMDEIEAALDDVNVYRFAAYLRRMTDNTQFILITHRRGTMEEADVLYGVTMQDEGISKLLELRSTEVAEKLGIDSK